MKIRELAQHWEENAKGRLTDTGYAIHLDVEAAARLAAITEMYPKRHVEELLGELIGASLGLSFDLQAGRGQLHPGSFGGLLLAEREQLGQHLGVPGPVDFEHDPAVGLRPHPLAASPRPRHRPTHATKPGSTPRAAQAATNAS